MAGMSNIVELAAGGQHSLVLSNNGAVKGVNLLRVGYANEGIVMPAGGRLDVWNSQFLQCNAGLVTAGGGTNSLHNVLFAACGDVVTGGTNSFTLTAEQMTADVYNLWEGPVAPVRVSVTNSVLLGTVGAISGQNVVINPATTNFQAAGAGYYYLAANSALRQAGTTNISPALLAGLKSRTTQAPLGLPSFMQLNGNLTLAPQAGRYTNGAPDLGYYYPALDYTVAALTSFGNLTVLPGTAVGFREEDTPNNGFKGVS
jgi:hypothetical protein